MYTKNVDRVHGMWTVCMECGQCAWNAESVYGMWTVHAMWTVCMEWGRDGYCIYGELKVNRIHVTGE